MLACTEVTINCRKHSRNRQHYLNKGYVWNLNGDIQVKIADLSPKSNIQIKIQCDYCAEEGKIRYSYPPYSNYQKSREIIMKDACGNCAHKKLKDVNEKRYGVSYAMQRSEVVAQFKKDFEEVKKAFELCGYTLETDNPHDYKNADTPLPYRCKKHPEIVQYTMYRTVQYAKGACQLCGNETRIRRGADSHFWKGGTVNLSMYLRERIKPWKNDSRAAWGKHCALSYKEESVEVHHASRSFRAIVEETLEVLNFPLYKEINQYTEEELELLEKKCLELHYSYGLGICLSSEAHNLYHTMYKIEDGNLESFIKFAKEVYGKEGSPDDWIIHQPVVPSGIFGKYYPPKKGSSSRFFGVSFEKRTQKWSCVVYYLNKTYRRQGFKTEIEAAYAFNQIVKKVKGDRAIFNRLTQEEEAYAKSCDKKIYIPKGKYRLSKYVNTKNILGGIKFYPLKGEKNNRFTNVFYKEKHQTWHYVFYHQTKAYRKGGFQTGTQAAYAYNMRVKQVKGEEAILNRLTQEEEKEVMLFFANQTGVLTAKRKGTSRFHGVSFGKREKKWLFQIKHQGNGYRMSGFEKEYEAAFAYNKKAIEIRGEKATLNVLTSDEMKQVCLDSLWQGKKECYFSY